MSFRDFSPKQPSGGGGSGSRTPPRTQNNNSPFKRSSSNNTNTNNNNKQRNPDLDSLQYSRSKSDSTYQNNFSPNYEENIGMITFEPSSQQYGGTPSQQSQQQQQMTIQQSPSIQRREDEYALQVMQQREGEIRTIQQKMNVVNEIYKDLGQVVDDQGTQINNVEDTFNRSNLNTQKGLEQLTKANTKGSKKNNSGGNSEEGMEGDNRRKQFFLFKYIQRSANEISKMVSVCTGGSNAAASYTVDDETTWNKQDDNVGG